MLPPKTLSHDNYTVGWICALPLEMAAATAMLDEIHPSLPQPPNDHNTYTLGAIEDHNAVIACLPTGVYGTTSATAVATQMLSTFPTIQFGLMVGIGGGAPSKDVDIRLGDVVVSTPTGHSSGVVQYDYGKTVSDNHFQQTGTLNKPPTILLTAVSQLIAHHRMGKKQMSGILSNALARNPKMKSHFCSPRPDQDLLFDAVYEHIQHEKTCVYCDISQSVNRVTRASDEPHIHYGIIASANQLMKHGPTRNRLAFFALKWKQQG